MKSKVWGEMGMSALSHARYALRWAQGVAILSRNALRNVFATSRREYGWVADVPLEGCCIRRLVPMHYTDYLWGGLRVSVLATVRQDAGGPQGDTQR
ncbi:MAG: hypothetical protein AAB177_00565, partial [Nitrospirota bacterium]